MLIIKKYSLTTLSRLPDTNIVFMEYIKNLRVDLLVAQELVASRLDFMGDQMHYILIDFSNLRQLTYEAKQYMQSAEGGGKNILGGAFIASNPVAALLANIFVKTQKTIPVKFFSDRKDALLWIEKLKQSSDNAIS